MSSERVVVESPKSQGPNEKVQYAMNFARWGTPAAPLVDIHLKSDPDNDLSSTLLDGIPSLDGDKIVTPLVIGLTRNTTYILRATGSIANQTKSTVCEIRTDEL